MNKFLATLLIGFSLISFPSWAANFEKGLAAYESGDYATALREWTPLAEQGNAIAQYKLGFIYENGVGVPQNYKTAVKWFTLGAEKGYAKAQLKLGYVYIQGQGVPQDYKNAYKWWTLAAEQGDADAQYNLGLKYEQGVGVPKDYVYAHMWWNISASNGNKNAARNRDKVAKKLNPLQLEKAQDLADECVAKEYKGC
ncbi:sel1 repeat family protein [Alphaproteobacteria bacterium]|nr:sel1 repeat family protein [Alphaproteobacteria bacterium]